MRCAIDFLVNPEQTHIINSTSRWDRPSCSRASVHERFAPSEKFPTRKQCSLPVGFDCVWSKVIGARLIGFPSNTSRFRQETLPNHCFCPRTSLRIRAKFERNFRKLRNWVRPSRQACSLWLSPPLCSCLWGPTSEEKESCPTASRPQRLLPF